MPGRRHGADLTGQAVMLDLFCGCSVLDTTARLELSTAALSRLLLIDESAAAAKGMFQPSP